jgi:HEAT repeat protein
MLADDPSPGARDALAHALDDKSWLVRAAAAQAMGLHGTLKDVPTLAPLLSDVHKQVRYRAAAAIIRVTNGLPNG